MEGTGVAAVPTVNLSLPGHCFVAAICSDPVPCDGVDDEEKPAGIRRRQCLHRMSRRRQACLSVPSHAHTVMAWHSTVFTHIIHRQCMPIIYKRFSFVFGTIEEKQCLEETGVHRHGEKGEGGSSSIPTPPRHAFCLMKNMPPAWREVW